MALLDSFTDELVKLARPLSSAAMVRRMSTSGALGGSAYFGGQKLLAGISGDRGPRDTLASAATRGAIGGALAAVALSALTKRRRIR